MRTALIVILAIHGLIHMMGFVKAFGLAELEQLTQPISRAMGVIWLLAAVGMGAAAATLITAPRVSAAIALAAVLLSQFAIVSAWSDAKFGTLANAAIVAGYAALLWRAPAT